MSGRLRIGVLGPFEVARNGKSVEIPPGKARALLALLLLDRGKVVPVDRLVEQLWDGRPPPSASKQIQVYVARLRKLVGDGLLVTSSPGYALRIEDEQLDAARFESLVESARGEQATAAARRLREALALWRGSPLVDFSYDDWAQEEIRRLEELHLEALEARIEADLALGRHEQAVGELKSLAHAHPLRERLQAQLMLALYRCGRQAEALEAYRSARRRLIDELGLEPSPELQQLERAILAHDPALAAPTPVGQQAKAIAVRMPSRLRAGRSRLLVAAGAIVVATAAAGAGVRLSEGGLRTLHASPNSVAVLDASRGSVRRVIEGVGRLGGIASGAHAVWATDTVNNFLLRIDPASGAIERIEVGDGPTGVVVGDGEVWVVNQLDRTVFEVNPQALKVVNKFPVGSGADAIAFGYGSVWVANDNDGTLSRINPAGNAEPMTIPRVGTPAGIAVGPQGVWVTSSLTGELLLVNPKINQVVQRYQIGNGPTGITVGSGNVWVANTPDDTVTRFDPGSVAVRKFPVGDSPVGITYGDGAVWVANSQGGTVSRIDPKTRSTRDDEVGNEPTRLASAGGTVWTTVNPSPASHRGGTLRVVSYPYPGSLENIDPAQPTGFAQVGMLSLTNDGLVTYRRIAGLGGDQLVPDLATAIQKPTNGGRTYTFQLRRGIRYSNGQLVKPEDFRRGLERVFRLPAAGPERTLYQSILGASACKERPQACDLSRGIVADDKAGTVTFHLTEPDGNFLYALAFSAADAVARGAPPDRNVGRKPMPATGPYTTRSFSPGHRWILGRNPYFHVWSSDAQPDGYPDRIVMTQYGQHDLAAQVGWIEHGSADVLSFPGLRYLGRLATRFTSQLHSDPIGLTSSLAINTRLPPFDRPAVRRALSYAIDRNRIVQYVGGPLSARPTCQILAPTQLGYQPYCPYTIAPSRSGSWTAPDFARAERLVQASGTRGMNVTLLMTRPDPRFAPTLEIGRYVVSVLDQLGYRASLKVVQAPWEVMVNPRSRGQIGEDDWNQFLSVSPWEFVSNLSCRGGPFSVRSATMPNEAGFCRPRIDAEARRASDLLAQDPAAGADAWSRVDRDLTDEAPLVPLFNTRDVVFLSRRVGNYEYHPFYNVLLDQLWVR